MHEIYQDEIDERAIYFSGLSVEVLTDRLQSLKAACETAGLSLENSKFHALDLLAILNQIGRSGKPANFPEDLYEWILDYLRKRNKERPELPKIVSIW